MKNPKSKIPIAVLGATGNVGQKFVELVLDHPWFEIGALCASENSVGRSFGEIATVKVPDSIRQMKIQPCIPTGECQYAFSALDAKVAGEIEKEYMRAGYTVVSNARNHRMDPDVPLLIPEVNWEHLALLSSQKGPGKIVTNPNCTTIGLSIALKPLLDHFGLEALHVVSLQALSGAGAAGRSLDIDDNVIPFIQGEEEKIGKEVPKILGTTFPISASCNRVHVSDGHLICVSVTLKKKASKEEIVAVWKGFKGKPQELSLPMAPLHPIHYFEDDAYPQPKHQRGLERGMAVSVGRLRPSANFDYQFVVLSHNLVRGAAGGSLLCAEACYAYTK